VTRQTSTSSGWEEAPTREHPSWPNEVELLTPSKTAMTTAFIGLSTLRLRGLLLDGSVRGGCNRGSAELRADRVDFGQLPRLFGEAKAVKSLGGRPLAVVTATSDRRAAGAPPRTGPRSSPPTASTGPWRARPMPVFEDKRFAAIASRAIWGGRVTRSFGTSLMRVEADD
jgi:hypothetical protein